MAYNFSQFLGVNDGSHEYVTDINYTQSYIEHEDSTKDPILLCQMGSAISDVQKCYYLKFKIQKMPDREEQGIIISGIQSITIKLAHQNPLDEDRQILKTITIPAGPSTEYADFELVISPDEIYDRIDFLLNRVAGWDKRIVTLQVIKLAEINNVIGWLGNINKLKQIGIQGPIGLKMCIDGEGIQIGRSGIYEINHGYSISFLGFVYYQETQDETLKPFILDYQY